MFFWKFQKINIFYISYCDIILTRKEMLRIFLSKRFGENILSVLCDLNVPSVLLNVCKDKKKHRNDKNLGRWSFFIVDFQHIQDNFQHLFVTLSLLE